MDLRKIEFKEVSIDDYDEVISIRASKDIEDGNDYLPDIYRLLLNIKSVVGFVAVMDGELIAFQIVQLIDDGKAYITRCARVKKIYEGLGVYKTFDDYIKQTYKLNGRRHVLSFGEENTHLMPKLNTDELRMITKRKYVEYWMTKKSFDITIIEEPIWNQNTRFVTEEDMLKFLRSDDLCSRLFPDDSIVCFWVLLKPIEANIPFIFLERTRIIGTFEPECTLISFGTFYRCLLGFVYIIDIYGTSHSKLKEHVQLHLKHLMEQVDEETILVYIVTDDTDNYYINDLMRRYGFQKGITRLSYHVEKMN